MLAWTFRRGCRAGRDSTGGQDVTQRIKIKDTPHTVHLAISLFQWCVKMCSCACMCTPIQQASSWAESGHRCIGVLKDNSANWGWIQSESDFPNLNCGGAKCYRWQKSPIPEDIFVSLQVIWVTSLPATLPFPLYTDQPESMVPVSILYYQHGSAQSSLSCNIKFRSSFLLCFEFKCLSKLSSPQRIWTPKLILFSFTQIWHSFPQRRILESKSHIDTFNLKHQGTIWQYIEIQKMQ